MIELINFNSSNTCDEIMEMRDIYLGRTSLVFAPNPSSITHSNIRFSVYIRFNYLKMQFTLSLLVSLVAAAPMAQYNPAASLGSFVGETTGSLVSAPWNLITGLGSGFAHGVSY
jgi:hypothetical protein